MTASLTAPRSAATLRLQALMDEQQRIEIGERLRELRDNSPETNRSVGDYVGVSERTVAEWSAGRQGMTYDHAQKVAELFGVDIDWLWRGREQGPTPDLIGQLHGDGPEIEERLARIEGRQAELLVAVGEVQRALEGLRSQLAAGERTRATRGS
jgi:transcriptional regulator with XRE-family HTH domain